ncbi:hypothetical protein [Luteibacter sp.]|uniref:hypothetical protein n=1 Tax=Luteibacter sp. TaxID=1886636 RepID=UPI003F8126B5
MSLLLSEAWDRSNYATGKASDIARQLALAGVAVIWLFKTTDASKPIAENMVFPLWLFLVSLLLDLLQYIVAGITWAAFSRLRERQHRSSAGTTKIKDSHSCINVPAWTLWTAKMLAMTYGYWELLLSLKPIIGSAWS